MGLEEEFFWKVTSLKKKKKKTKACKASGGEENVYIALKKVWQYTYQGVELLTVSE